MSRKKAKRDFRPTLGDLRLEPRLVMTTTPFKVGQYLLTHPSLAAAKAFNDPKFLTNHSPLVINRKTYNHGIVDVQTARGGASAIVAAPDGSRFRLSLSLADNQYDGGLSAETGSAGTLVVPSSAVQAKGTVRAYAMPGGKVGIIIDGSTSNQQLTIDPLPFHQRKGFAHSFAYGEGSRTHVLNVGSINVTSGSIAGILGYHSANLSGPLSISGTTTVDRIAFNSIQPGAVIGVGGSVNTLDVATNVTLTTGPGISVGRDLNLLNVGGNVALANGASIRVGRFLGLTPQPPKGTAGGSNILALNQSTIGSGSVSGTTPSVSSYIQGDLIIGPGSIISAGTGIANSSILSTSGTTGGSASPVLINGILALAPADPVNAPTSQLVIPNLLVGSTFTRPDTNSATGTSPNNFIARSGVTVNGVTVVTPA